MTRELRISRHLDGRRARSCSSKRLPTKSPTPFRQNHLGPSLPADHDVPAEQQKELFQLVEERYTHQGNEWELRSFAGYDQWIVKKAVEE